MAAPTLDTRFIVLKADMTGDIWHVAAACALWPELRETDPAAPLATWRPRPAIIVGDNAPAGVMADGRSAFQYLHSIALDPIVAMLPQDDFGYFDRLTHKYLEVVAHSFDQSLPGDWEAAVAISRRQKDSVPPADRNANGPTNDKMLVPLATTTAMVMQMMEKLTVPAAIGYLGTALSAGLGDDVKAEVEKTVDTLADLIETQASNSVVLLNYRQGQVNVQHNTNENIKNSLTDKAGKLKVAVVSIPQMQTQQWTAGILKGHGPKGAVKDAVFDLYNLRGGNAHPIPGDRRAKVWFWKRVADRLQMHKKDDMIVSGSIVGITGGRSGSLDLPSFVGLRCLSWDDPLLAWDLTAGISGKKTKLLKEQASQFVRLLNQWPLMSMAYTSPDPRSDDLDWDDGKIQRWLEMSAAPLRKIDLAHQALPAASDEMLERNLEHGMRFGQAGENYRGRMERPELGIKATHLDGLMQDLKTPH